MSRCSSCSTLAAPRPGSSPRWIPRDYDRLFALCDLGFGFPELGHLSLSEARAVRGPLGLGIERDLHFTGRHPLSVYAEAARAAGRIVESGPELDAAARRRNTAGTPRGA